MQAKGKLTEELLKAQDRLLNNYYGNLQCEKCKFHNGTEKCSQWSGRKPNEILSCDSTCSKYQRGAVE